MESDREASQRLIDQPPGYDDVEPSAPREEFEIEDPQETEPSNEDPDPNGRGWFSSVRQFGKQRITIPVRYLIDPITNFYNQSSLWIDGKLNRFVNPLLAKRFFVVLVACVIILVVRFKYSSSFGASGRLRDHDILRDLLKSKIDLGNMVEMSDFFGKEPHFAGSKGDYSTSNYVYKYFQSLGLPTTFDRHDVFLSHGNETLCELKFGDEVRWSSQLTEGTSIKAPTLSQLQPHTQMSLSLPGDAEGQLVYANFGSNDDFKAVDCDGKIVILKYSHEPPGSVAMRAEKAGARGVLFMSAKHPTEPSWPNGRDYPADAVQQGSLGTASLYPGDILSPGWPSSMMMKVDINNAYVAHIPVAAISWNDAAPLLNSLKGHGTRMDDTSAAWGNNGAPESVGEWWTGPNPDSTVRLKIDPIVEERHEIRNVFGHLEGREMGNRAVIIGARLDSMCYGSSQLAGLNVLLEVARVFADFKYTNQWEPLRSIYFTAWDGTSLNYAGVTEWVETVVDNLSLEGVVYIDLDEGISGPDFLYQGNPVVQAEELLKKVAYDGHTLFDAVDRKKSFQPIPGYGNHIAFESHTGVPSIKLGFHSADKPAPRDSCFDNHLWMDKFGDPDHSRHFALAEILTYLALELSDAPLLPFDFTVMGQEIHRYINVLEEKATKVFGQDQVNEKAVQDALTDARESANEVISAGELFNRVRDQWNDFAKVNQDSKTGDLPDSQPISRVRILWNEKVAQANKLNLDRNGISARNWYKNHLFGPEFFHNDDDNLVGTFPAVNDALNVGIKDHFVETLTDATLHIQHMADYLTEMLI